MSESFWSGPIVDKSISRSLFHPGFWPRVDDRADIHDLMPRTCEHAPLSKRCFLDGSESQILRWGDIILGYPGESKPITGILRLEKASARGQNEGDYGKWSERGSVRGFGDGRRGAASQARWVSSQSWERQETDPFRGHPQEPKPANILILVPRPTSAFWPTETVKWQVCIFQPQVCGHFLQQQPENWYRQWKDRGVLRKQ